VRPMPKNAYFLAGPRGVETALMRQATKYALLIAPLVVVAAWGLRGTDGFVSAVLGAALALGNLWLSALLFDRAARISVNALYAAALFGFIGRLGILTAVFFGLKQLPFVDVTVLGLVLLATYVGMLIAEAFAVMAGERDLGSTIGPSVPAAQGQAHGPERNTA
jgi:hypothetical protein